MPRARTQTQDSRTAAALDQEGSGCLSGYMIPPLTVLLVSGLLAGFAFRQPPAARPAEFVVASTPTAARPAVPASPQAASPTLTPTDPPESASAIASIITNTPAPSGLFDWFTVDTRDTTASSSLSPVFTPEVQYWRDDILRWASESGLDPNLAAVVMQIESCGYDRATSSAGAIGLFQVMPYHFQPFDNPYDPDVNARRGLAYLARSLEAAGGNARLALAGYNGGIGVISRGEWTWPGETARYVYFGAPIYEDARSGSSTSAVLDEWYAKYGAGLCRRARESQ